MGSGSAPRKVRRRAGGPGRRAGERGGRKSLWAGLSTDARWLAAILIATILTYVNALPNGFVYDDHLLVEGNRLVQQRDVAGIFTTHYWEGGNPANASGHYRPLTILSLLVDALGGMTPFRYHLTNVLLHAANSLLAFGVCRRAGFGATAAGIAGLLFAVHPVHAEAAAGVTSGRADLLAALFVLMGLYAYLQYLAEHRPIRYVASLGSFCLGLLCKESALVLVGLVPFADLTAEPEAEAHKGWRRLAAKAASGWRRWLGFALAFVLYLGVRRWAAGLGFSAGSVSVMMHPLLNAPLATRLFTAASLFWKYLALVAVPWRLSVDYSYNALPVATTLVRPGVVLGILCAVATGLLWLWSFGRWRRAFFAGALFLVPYAAVSQTLILLNSMFQERYVYLPVLGLFALAGLGAQRLWRSRGVWAAALMGIVVAAYAARTVVRNGDWRDDRALFSSALAAYPESARMHQALGEVQAAAGEMGSAIRSFERALAILESPGTQNNLGNAFGVVGDFDRALAAYRRAVALDPEYGEAWGNLGLTALRAGRVDDAQRALQTASRLMPGDPDVHYNLGVALAQAGDVRGAVAAYRRALSLRPDWPEACFNLANLQWEDGDRASAVRLYRRFLAAWSGDRATAEVARARIRASERLP